MYLSRRKIGKLAVVLAAGVLATSAARAQELGEDAGPDPGPRYYRFGPQLREKNKFVYQGKSRLVSKYGMEVVGGHLQMTPKNLVWSTPLDGNVITVTVGWEYVTAATKTDFYLLDARTGRQLAKMPLPPNVLLRAVRFSRRHGQETICVSMAGLPRVEFTARELIESQSSGTSRPR
jgi:hypothetical protein